MDSSKVKGVGHSEVPGSIVEIIEREFSGDSRNANSLMEIFEILKQNRFEIVAGINCDEVLEFVNWVKLSEQSIQ
jgi:hypothetical protein